MRTNIFSRMALLAGVLAFLFCIANALACLLARDIVGEATEAASNAVVETGKGVASKAYEGGKSLYNQYFGSETVDEEVVEVVVEEEAGDGIEYYFGGVKQHFTLILGPEIPPRGSNAWWFEVGSLVCGMAGVILGSVAVTHREKTANVVTAILIGLLATAWNHIGLAVAMLVIASIMIAADFFRRKW